jgi:hypothetical protein
MFDVVAAVPAAQVLLAGISVSSSLNPAMEVPCLVTPAGSNKVVPVIDIRLSSISGLMAF